MTKRFDLIVVGAGTAGVSAANTCALRGWSVAIVDALPYGGTCALRGCDPKKILGLPPENRTCLFALYAAMPWLCCSVSTSSGVL